MKTLRNLIASIFISLPVIVSAQPYSIDWYTIDGGGGTSSGGPYTLTGTIGQPDAGTMSGGNYALEGGFWSGAVAVQQVGAPTLEITGGTPGNVTISWTPATPGFVLQFSDAIESTQWTDAPSGSQNPVTLASPASFQIRFYRLKRP